jgi:membrane associated rhomboid family serine protease
MCPECQRVAAVGFQCVDCVKEQARTVRQARTVFGGEVATGALVTRTLIAACVAVFAGQMLLTGVDLTRRFMFVPVLATTEPYRFLTAAFLHSPNFFLHIVFNMYALWLTGPYLEHLLGRARFLALYLVSAVGGSVMMYVLASPTGQSWVTGGVGASGAVFGLWGAIMVLNWRQGMDNRGWIGLLVINGLIGFLPGVNIAWQAHLGGLVTGAAVGAVYALTPAARRRVGHPAGVAAVLAVLVALTLAKAATVPASAVVG